MRLSAAKMLLVVVLVFICVPSSYAIMGIGGNWSKDLTTKLDDTPDSIGEQAIIGGLVLSTSALSLPGLPAIFQDSITGKDVPIFVDRTNFKAGPMNFGGKLYVDIIPVIDAIEIAGNFYSFGYKGQVRYPTSITQKSNISGASATDFKSWVDVLYDTASTNVDFFGDSVTPFAKLQLDATIRKTVIKLPPLVGIVKLYAGAGPSVIFATPVLSGGLIEKALAEAIDGQPTGGFDLAGLSTNLLGADNQKKIQDYFIEKLMTPHYGFHIVAGAQVKPPVVPLALYADMKFTIGGKLDDTVDISATGLTLQLGAALAF